MAAQQGDVKNQDRRDSRLNHRLLGHASAAASIIYYQCCRRWAENVEKPKKPLCRVTVIHLSIGVRIIRSNEQREFQTPPPPTVCVKRLIEQSTCLLEKNHFNKKRVELAEPLIDTSLFIGKALELEMKARVADCGILFCEWDVEVE